MIPELLKGWACRTCDAQAVQRPPRSLELLPTPPHGWLYITTTEVLPARTIVTGPGEKTKAGEARRTEIYVFCPACADSIVFALNASKRVPATPSSSGSILGDVAQVEVPKTT